MPGDSYSSHLKSTFLLAYPVVISQVGHMLVNLTDTVLIGHLGAVKLAACSLGISIFAVFMVFGIGIAYGLTPLIARNNGAGNKAQCGTLLYNSLFINTITGLIIASALYFVSPRLHLLGQDKEVVALASPFLRIIGFSMIPLMIFLSFKQFAEGLAFTRQAMVITLIADGFNIILTYALINGAFGLPRWELEGAGWANFISRTLMAVMMTLYIIYSKNFKEFRVKFKLKLISIKDSLEIVYLGIPSAFQYLFEVGAFSVSALMIGWLGPNYQAAHQIAINLAAFTYMAASGLAAAATVRVGNALGERNFQKIRMAGNTAYIMVIIFMAFNAGLFILGRNLFPLLYINNDEVISIASGLLIIAAFFQLSDGTQVVGLGALRGLGDVKIPTLITFTAYWIVAIPLGYWMGFSLGMGVSGIWYALLIGLSISALLLYWRFKNLSRRMILDSIG